MLVLAASSASLPPVVGASQGMPCLIFIDANDGNVWRSRVDGSGRVLMIRSRAVRAGRPSPGVGLAVTPPSPRSRGSLHLTSVPTSAEGYIALEAAPAGSYVWNRGLAARSAIPPLRYTDTGRPSGWTLSKESRSVEIEPGHAHPVITAIHLQRGQMRRSYRFSKPVSNQEGAFLGVVSSENAVIKDSADLLLWNLRTGERRVIASAVQAVLWPGNDATRGRLRPTAKAFLRSPNTRLGLERGVYKWTVKNPDDIRVRPEYLVRRVPL